MSFLETVERARAFLERNGRISLRALRREFDLDDETQEELIEELVETQRVAVRDGRALAWVGAASAMASELPKSDLAPGNAANSASPAGHSALPEGNRRLPYTPKHLADKILQSRSALEGERKQVSVLFADVKGSMEISGQLDPEEWHAILDRFFQILNEGVHHFEGTVNQYTGDGIMALFGAPIAHEDHAQRACYAALHLCDALRAYAQQLRRERGLVLETRIGVNSGEVVVGKIGDDLRMDYTAQGHTVGLAERMQQLAEAGKPYLAEASEALVRGYFQLEALGSFEVKGVAAPVQVFGLEGVGELRTRLDRSRARGFSKFVGRADELNRLDTALERALSGEGQVLGVVAVAGIGKSRLCHEFAERCRARGIRVRHATGVSHGQSIPLLPILEFLRESFGVTAQDTDLAARQKIAGAIFLADQELQGELPLLFDFLGVPDPERPAPTLAPEARQRRLLELVKRLSLARSRREPAVLLFEDLHWIDAATQSFVEALAEATEGSRTLMVVNYRPEYRADWTHRSYFEQLALRPLDVSGVEEMLAEWLGDDPSLAGVGERLAARTAGNPFFVEEVVLAMIEAGRLSGVRGHYRLVGDRDEIEIPSSVHDVLAARIDRLGESEKQILQSAAVIGGEFSESLLARVEERPAAELAEPLRRLVEAEFLYERALYPELEYAFKHPLTQEVALSTQLRDRRQRTHASVATVLEEHCADALDENAALLAHHWEQAGEPLLAARWYDRAADWFGFGSPSEALSLARRVRDILDGVPDSPDVLGLQLKALGRIALHASRLGLDEGELDAIVEEGSALLSRVGAQPADEMTYRLSIGLAYSLNGRLGDAIVHGQETVAREAALEGQDVPVQGPIMMALFNAERVDEALGLGEALLGGRDPVEAASELAFGPVVLAVRGAGATCAGQLGEAGRLLDRAIELAVEQRDLAAQDVAHGNYASLERHRGFPRAALARGRQAVELAEQVASPAGLRHALYQLGHAQLANGELAAARAVVERALATGRGRYFSVQLLSALAETLSRQGEHDHACETAREAIAVAEATGQSEISAQIALARVLRSADGPLPEEEIDEALSRAAARIDEFGAHVYRPQVHEEHAELARLRGDEAECRRELGEALRLYTKMGATGHAERLSGE
jgi:class 3 adenylate cyclase/tetratricopeptide (TPR) repeat protein